MHARGFSAATHHVPGGVAGILLFIELTALAVRRREEPGVWFVPQTGLCEVRVRPKRRELSPFVMQRAQENLKSSLLVFYGFRLFDGPPARTALLLSSKASALLLLSETVT